MICNLALAMDASKTFGQVRPDEGRTAGNAPADLRRIAPNDRAFTVGGGEQTNSSP